MEEALQCGQEPKEKVSIHCQPLQAFRGRCYEENQSGLALNSFPVCFECSVLVSFGSEFCDK